MAWIEPALDALKASVEAGRESRGQDGAFLRRVGRGGLGDQLDLEHVGPERLGLIGGRHT